MAPADYLTLVEALGVGPGAVVALVGGGGKTSTLFRLARESARDGRRVLATTTARMKIEELAPVRDVLLWDERDPTGGTWRRCRDEGAHSGWIEHILGGERSDTQIPAAFLGRSIMRDKLLGLPPEYLGELLGRLTWDVVVVEADGSRGRSVKGHRLGEPILPLCATHVVIVIGADGLESPVNEQTCHRPEVIQDLLRLAWGERLSPGRLAELLCHPRGLLAKIPGDMQVLIYLNKSPLGSERAAARGFARTLLERCNGRVKRIAVGDNLQGGLVETHLPEAPGP
jgi:probable selenium-dependent hydroxylase accessory protein YqeC